MCQAQECQRLSDEVNRHDPCPPSACSRMGDQDFKQINPMFMRKKPRVLSEMIQMLDAWLFLEENLRETEESGVQPQVPRIAIPRLFVTVTHMISDVQLPEPLRVSPASQLSLRASIASWESITRKQI